MEIFGFVVLIVIGLVLVYYGIAMEVVAQGFGGRTSVIGPILVVCGVIELYATWMNKPFEIIIK